MAPKTMPHARGNVHDVTTRRKRLIGQQTGQHSDKSGSPQPGAAPKGHTWVVRIDKTTATQIATTAAPAT